MKKFKKLLLTLCCFTLLFTSCFYLSGCDTAEETKNAINASTEVVPFEYSQSAATNILMSAFTNSLKQNFYKVSYTGDAFINGVKQENPPKFEAYFFTKDGKNAFAYREVTNPDAHTHIIATISGTAYDLDLTAKTYSEDTNYLLTYGLVAQKSACTNIIAGTYYKGADHIYGVLENLGMKTYYEWVIKDNLIIAQNQFVSLGEFDYGFINQTFDYTNVNESTLPNIPTSLDGYTEQ